MGTIGFCCGWKMWIQSNLQWIFIGILWIGCYSVRLFLFEREREREMNRPRLSLTLSQWYIVARLYYIVYKAHDDLVRLVIASKRHLEVDHISYSLLVISFLIYFGFGECGFFFHSCFHRNDMVDNGRTKLAAKTFHKINPICNLICDISVPKKAESVVEMGNCFAIATITPQRWNV